jgi:hypothetical protein
MSSIKITKDDSFVWLLITEKSREIFMSGLFSMYILYDDDSETLIEGYSQLLEALENGMDIGLEVGKIPSKEPQADLQKEVIKKSGINIVSCGMCAEVILHRVTDEAVVCPHCKFSEDPCHFPDLYY